jgi:hypothetical protein
VTCAGGVETYFRDKFVRRVNAECEKGGDAGFRGCVSCTWAAHNYGKDVNLCTRPMWSNGIGEGGVPLSNQLCGVRDIVFGAQRNQTP